MAQTYGQIKKMKTAKIGTIMPWAGDGNVGTLASNIPTGWLLCNGTSHPANRYPLLTSVLGNSYGGNVISGDFPHYEGSLRLPDITGRAMMDLEPEMLFNSKYNAGQSDAWQKLVDSEGQALIVDDGFTKSIPTLISADTDIVFTIDSDLVFSGKFKAAPGETNISVTDPAFSTTVYTIGRKLGISHMPYHNHPGTYTSAVGGAKAPELFFPSGFEVSGSGGGLLNCPDRSWYEAFLSDPDGAPTWCNGAGTMTYYDDTTLIETNRFNNFESTADQDYSYIPPLTVDNVVYESPSAFTTSFTAKPRTTHAMKAWEGYFPRPMEWNSRRNFFGYGTNFIGPSGVQDDPEYRPAFSLALTLQALQTTISVPAGTSIGVDFDFIRPFMYVSSPISNPVYISPGTQVLNIEQTDDTGSGVGYNIELSEVVQGSGSLLVNVVFRDGAYPTSMNTVPAGQDPAGNTFQSHTHGTFELTMGSGLKGPVSFPVNDVNKGDIKAETIDNALNILANVANPSQNIVYIIRAF